MVKSRGILPLGGTVQSVETTVDDCLAFSFCGLTFAFSDTSVQLYKLARVGTFHFLDDITGQNENSKHDPSCFPFCENWKVVVSVCVWILNDAMTDRHMSLTH